MYTLSYCNDVVLFTQNVESHLEKLQLVFDRLRRAHLKISPQKCVFASHEVKYLGHIFSMEGIADDPAKTSVLSNLQPPKNVKELKAILATFGFYREFVLSFSKRCQNMTKLLRKDVDWNWTDLCQNEFIDLRSEMTSAPILAFFDPQLPTILYSDANDGSLEFWLAKCNTTNQQVAIGYAGRSLNKTERNYNIFVKETLAMICCICTNLSYGLWHAIF